MKKVLLTTVMSLMMCMGVYAQTTYEWQKPPKPTEIEIAVITSTVDAGELNYFESGKLYHDTRKQYSIEQLYERLYTKAKNDYAESHPKFALRNFKSQFNERHTYSSGDVYRQYYELSAIVVEPNPKELANDNLSKVFDKALRNVRQGSRIAIDQVSVWSGINREDYKDQVIDVLLDKGYKVVAKEYLERLYEEQQAQQSGIYNERTTVQENNFSAVGYYINVKVTETSLRVQVVNVSTGEYEGNATVNF